MSRTALLRLTLARACAWALLLAGWVGLGGLAQRFAPTTGAAFALVALWLLSLGAAAAPATRGGLRRGTRALLLVGAAALAGAGLWASTRGGGLPALLSALLGWAALTALASGVVRGLRLAQSAPPAPPVAAASLGALAAALVLGDPGDLPALSARLALFAGAVGGLLVLLQRQVDERPRPPGCRAGLFDCSLPAWPRGAWRDLQQWPLLLAGLAMLPMMAALPLMAAWCRADGIAPEAMVLLHFAAMFGPALLLRRLLDRGSTATLSLLCAVLLGGGAALATWAPAPFGLLGVAVAHGAAWGLAWSGQLWAPDRRGRQGTSPLRAAAGYALLTLAFGLIVEQTGARGVAVSHAVLGLAAATAWLSRTAAVAWREARAQRHVAAAPPGRPGT